MRKLSNVLIHLIILTAAGKKDCTIAVLNTGKMQCTLVTAIRKLTTARRYFGVGLCLEGIQLMNNADVGRPYRLQHLYCLQIKSTSNLF